MGAKTVRSQNDTFGDTLYSDGGFDAVREVAKERGVAPAQVALAWLLGKPG